MVNYRGVKLNERNTLITAEIMQTYDLLKFALARSNGSSFLLITQYEMPFKNKSEAKKRSKDRKIYGKCTNGTNRRSRVWPVYNHAIVFISLTCHLNLLTDTLFQCAWVPVRRVNLVVVCIRVFYMDRYSGPNSSHSSSWSRICSVFHLNICNGPNRPFKFILVEFY